MYHVPLVKSANSLYNRNHDTGNTVFIKMELVRIVDIVSQRLPLVLRDEVKVVLVFEMIDKVDDTTRLSKLL